jgi:hypothetical protein
MHAANTGHDQLSKPPGKTSRFAAHSPLLEHLDSRYKALGLGEAKPYNKPRLDAAGSRFAGSRFAAAQADRSEAAAQANAKAHPSDPWALGRIRLHLRQGYALASETLADATRILQAREASRRSA